MYPSELLYGCTVLWRWAKINPIFPRHLANFEGNTLQLHFMFVATHDIAYFAFSGSGNSNWKSGMNVKRITQ